MNHIEHLTTEFKNMKSACEEYQRLAVHRLALVREKQSVIERLLDEGGKAASRIAELETRVRDWKNKFASGGFQLAFERGQKITELEAVIAALETKLAQAYDERDVAVDCKLRKELDDVRTQLAKKSLETAGYHCDNKALRDKNTRIELESRNQIISLRQSLDCVREERDALRAVVKENKPLRENERLAAENTVLTTENANLHRRLRKFKSALHDFINTI